MFPEAKNVKFNAVHNIIDKTFAVFGCPKVACCRDGARDFFCYSPVNNALSPSRAERAANNQVLFETFSARVKIRNM